MFSNLTGWHAVIILAIVLLLFGAAKLPALAKSAGESMKIFKNEVKTTPATTTAPDAAADSAALPAATAPATPAATVAAPTVVAASPASTSRVSTSDPDTIA